MPTLIKGRQVASESPRSPEARILRLEPTDDPVAFAERLGAASHVEVHFPKFGDGRGFSIGRLLRDRYGYKGELRAVGHLTRDHLLYLERCGFDAYELRPGEEAPEALSGFEVFSARYQK
jgi:uncharacterized protein (DUF934 family)